MIVTLVALLLISQPLWALEKGEILDMTYSLSSTSLTWPGTGEPFELRVLIRGPQGPLPWMENNAFCGAEHSGTHMDAPAHFSQGKHRIDDIPVDKLVGPAVRIDISEKAEANRDYSMTADDLRNWEEDYGKIPEGALLFVYTGWGDFYPDRLAYFGSARNDTHLDKQGKPFVHFPGMAPEAAEWLVSYRKISGVGIDAPSIDTGIATDSLMAHRTLFAANIYVLENVANLDMLPNVGTTAIALPMKIEDGGGAPVRIIAMRSGAGAPAGVFTLVVGFVFSLLNC